MAFASLVPVPLVFLLTSTIARRTRVLFKEQQDALGALNGHIEETVSGIQAVKAFGREPEAGSGSPASTESCAAWARGPRSGRGSSCP